MAEKKAVQQQHYEDLKQGYVAPNMGNIMNYFGSLLAPPSPSISETSFEVCSTASIDSEEHLEAFCGAQSRSLTEFPRYESNSMPRPIIRRPSNLDMPLTISRNGSISNPDAIPIQYYRLNVYAGIESAITQNRITKYTLRIVHVKIGETSKEYTSLRRYSQMRKLYERLVKDYPQEMMDAPEFPQKELLVRLSDEVIRSRVIKLDRLVKFLVLHPLLIKSDLVQDFIIGRYPSQLQ